MVWQHWVNFILGLWIVLSAYMNFSVTGFTTNFTIIGIVIAILALWGALQQKSRENRTRV